MSRSLTAKQQFWSQHLEQADNFNGSLADYARSQGLSVQHLYQWRTVLRKRELTQVATSTVFTEVIQPSFARPTLLLHLGPAQLEFATLPDPTWLAQIIRDE